MEIRTGEMEITFRKAEQCPPAVEKETRVTWPQVWHGGEGGTQHGLKCGSRMFG